MTESGDPRLSVIRHRLSRIKHVVPVMSSKGGVGKTLVSCLISLSLSDRGFKVGLLDLDITNPTAHVVLGVNVSETLPEEEKGVIPPEISGVKFMSVAYYTRDNPLPLRGWEVDNVIREVLTITRWGSLDYLIIDTPPGIKDESLDVLRYFPEPKPLTVTTPSPLTMLSVRRLLKLLSEEVSEGFLVENIVRGSPSEEVARMCREFGFKYLGSVGFDPSIDSLIGDVDGVKSSRMYADVLKIVESLIKYLP